MATVTQPRILIVDDESTIRTMLARHFKLLGYDTSHQAANGEEALAILAQQAIEVVISDIKMPRMDGLQLLKRMRLEYPMVQTIIITGYVTLENLLAAMRYGAAGCIFKPLEDMAELEAEVARAVERLNTWQQKLKALMGMKPEENPS